MISLIAFWPFSFRGVPTSLRLQVSQYQCGIPIGTSSKILQTWKCWLYIKCSSEMACSLTCHCRCYDEPPRSPIRNNTSLPAKNVFRRALSYQPSLWWPQLVQSHASSQSSQALSQLSSQDPRVLMGWVEKVIEHRSSTILSTQPFILTYQPKALISRELPN